MKQLDWIIRALIIFLIIYFALSALHTMPLIKQAHNHFYNSVGQVVFNTINPRIYADFSIIRDPNKPDHDISYSIYDKRLYGRKVYKKSFRKIERPDYIISHSILYFIHIPTILLISLVAATPLSTKRKIISFFLALLIYYIYITLYISYRFELVLLKQSPENSVLEARSLWQNIVKFVGGYGNNEQNLIMAVLCWALVCFTPSLGRLFTLTENPTNKT